MDTTADTWNRNQLARLAGLLYLIVVATGVFSLGYVPAQLNVRGDLTATFANIVNFELLFRLGNAASLLCYCAFLLLPLALYKLLHSTDRRMAGLMVVLSLASVPISFMNLLNKFDVASLVSGAAYAQELSREQLQLQVGLLLTTYGNGLLLLQLFWGLWLLPFGILVYRCGFLPRLLGALLVVGGLGYVADLFILVLYPGFVATGIGDYLTLPASLGEIGVCLWLLVIGVPKERTAAADVALATAGSSGKP